MYFFDVNSCLYLWNVVQAALILLLISSVSCWWKEILWPKYFTLSFFANISMLISPMLIYIFVTEFMLLWLLRMFVLSGWILSPTFSVASLNSHIMFRICSLEVANNITSSANLRFVRQSWSWSLRWIPIPLFFCNRWISSFREYWKIVLNNRLDSGSPCFDPLWMSKMLLSSSACTDAFWSLVYLPQEADVAVIDVARFEGIPNLFVRDGIERLHEINCRCPHFDSPLMALLFNQSVCCKVVCCLVRFFWSQPDLLLVSGQALGIIFCTELSRTICATRAMNKSGGNYSHFSCVSLLSSLSSSLQAWIPFS